MRYYIDDHIYDVFELLAKHGHSRIIYMPDVVFEHLNVVINSAGKREYQYNSKIKAQDATLFYEMARARVALATRLAQWIDAERGSRAAVERRGSPFGAARYRCVVAPAEVQTIYVGGQSDSATHAAIRRTRNRTAVLRLGILADRHIALEQRIEQKSAQKTPACSG